VASASKHAGERPARRADARRNVATILDAAAEVLSHDPDASMADLARAAGVGRVTLYGHFESRATLVAEVVAVAMRQSEEVLAAVDLTGDPVRAVERLMSASWHVTHRHGALVQAAERSLEPEVFEAAHELAAARVRALLRRGRRAGCFRTDMPLGWQVAMIQSILHGASAAVNRGEFTSARAERLVVITSLATLVPVDANGVDVTRG
jgi:TetR/AcrR family transcriptional repressor of mexCD-oprJ operon